MISRLAIWYLRVRKKSTLIGYEFNGGKMRPLHDVNYIYDNKLTDVDYRSVDGTVFNIPDGKFRSVKYKLIDQKPQILGGDEMREHIENYICGDCGTEFGLFYAQFEAPSCPKCGEHLNVTEITRSEQNE